MRAGRSWQDPLDVCERERDEDVGGGFFRHAVKSPGPRMEESRAGRRHMGVSLDPGWRVVSPRLRLRFEHGEANGMCQKLT